MPAAPATYVDVTANGSDSTGGVVGINCLVWILKFDDRRRKKLCVWAEVPMCMLDKGRWITVCELVLVNVADTVYRTLPTGLLDTAL